MTLGITYEQFEEIRTADKCFYCLNAIDFEQDLKSSFLDRLDNAMPYIKDNLVLCCRVCNVTKHKCMTPIEQIVISALRIGDLDRVQEALKHASLFAEYGSGPDRSNIRKLRAQHSPYFHKMKRSGLL